MSACRLYFSKLLLDQELSFGHLKFKISNWRSYPKPTHSSVFSSVIGDSIPTVSCSDPRPSALAGPSLSNTYIWHVHRSTHVLPLHHLVPGSLWRCSNLIPCFLPTPLQLSEWCCELLSQTRSLLCVYHLNSSYVMQSKIIKALLITYNSTWWGPGFSTLTAFPPMLSLTCP